EPEVEQIEEPEQDPEVEPEVEQIEEPEQEPEAEPEVEQIEEPEAEPEHEPEAEPEIEQIEEPEAAPEQESEVEPESEPVVEPEQEQEAETEAEPTQESGGSDDAESGIRQEAVSSPEATQDGALESVPEDGAQEEIVSEETPKQESEDEVDDVSAVEPEALPEVEPGTEAQTDEPSPEPETAVSWPAASFAARTSGVNVTVTADEGAFPEGTTMSVRRVWDADALSEIRESVADDFVKVRRVQLVDIAFYDAEGNEIEPRIPVSVVISVSEINDDQSAVVVHMDDEGQTQIVANTDVESASGRTNLNVELPAGDTEPGEVEIEQTEVGAGDVETEISFDADGFSLYAVVVTETISTHYIDASGNTYSVEVSYGPEAGIPSGAKLAVSELEGDEAEAYAARAAAALNVNGSQVAYAKALDISILADGTPVQPQTPVSVSIKLLDAPEAAENTNLDVIHFGDDPKSVSCTLEGDAVIFEADGFSVYVVTFTRTVEETPITAQIQVNDSKLLSEVLTELNASVSEGMKLNIDGIASAESSDTALLTVEPGDGDWMLTPNEAFEGVTLTLTLKNDAGTVVLSVLSEAKLELTITADSDSKTYDGTELSVATWKLTAGSLADGDTIKSVAVTGGQTNAGSSENVPSAAVIQHADGDDVTASYAISYVNGTLTVNPAGVTLTANSGTETFDGTEKTVTGFTSSVDGLAFDGVTAGGSGTNAGTYDVTFSGVTVNETKDATGNYVVTGTTDGTLTIGRATVTVKAGATKAYGDADSDAIPTSVEGGVVDRGLVNIIGLAASDKGGTLVSAKDESTGDITYSYNVGSDDETVTLLTFTAERETGEVPRITEDLDELGTYPITLRGEQTQGNYTVSYENGGLTITKRPVDITAVSATKVYDGTPLTAEGYNSTELAFDDEIKSVTVPGSQTLAGSSANTPSAAKIVSGEDDVTDRYAINYVNGTLTVSQKPLTITADSAEKAYDGTALTKDSYANTELAEYDSITSVTVTGSQTEVGSSTNVPSAAVITNGDGEDVTESYDITYANGTLTVNAGSATLKAKSTILVADDSEHEITGFTSSVSGLTFEGVEASGKGTTAGIYPVEFTGLTKDEATGKYTTTDTTDKYTVEDAIPGRLIIVDQAPVQKKLTDFDGNLAEYTITFNPDHLTLNNGGDLVLKDTFDDKQAIIYNTVIVPSGVTYDYSVNTGTFAIPDGTTVEITYKTRVKGNAGDTVTFTNTAQLGIGTGSAFEELYKTTLSSTKTITPTGTDIEGSGGVYTIRLFAYSNSGMETGLAGAEFRLLDSNQRPITNAFGSEVLFTTGSNGYVTVELHDGTVAIQKNTVYHLEMTKAPVVTNDDGSYTYYQIDNTRYNFLITDNPDYDFVDENGNRIYSYYNGDVLKVRCYPEAAGINVTKRFSGNHNLNDGQKKSIEFVLQKEVAGRFVDVESHKYSDFSYGSMHFSTVPEMASNYQVVERGADVASLGIDSSVQWNSSATITYYQNGKLINRSGSEFEVNPDQEAFSFSIVFDNEYVDNKLTITKLDAETGDVLSGA
ncbi:MAG: hypothetical protein IJH25_00650, partial [Clostridia bacterium]|nr:hypothetical protein [Clostridia bacterium]